MKSLLWCAAAAAVVSLGAMSARADSLLYGFEAADSPNNLDGFAANGGGITVTHDTIGATQNAALGVSGSTGSMKNVTVAGATFTGALTGSTPAALNDPSVTALQFDYTVAPGDQFAGAFADIGVTIFGALGSGASETFGNQFQVDASSEQNIALAPGTYHLTVPLIGTSPADFSLHDSFATLLGQGFIPTGVEFFYSKSNDGAVTDYIDNVATVTPEPASMLAAGSALGLLLRRNRRAR